MENSIFNIGISLCILKCWTTGFCINDIDGTMGSHSSIMQDYSINELIEKISADTIIIPKSVAFRKDVYEESKTLFGVVFTECVNDLRSYGSFIDGKTVGKMMKEYVMDMTIPDIQCECLCSPTMASAARSETVMLINKTNLLECLRESQVI